MLKKCSVAVSAGVDCSVTHERRSAIMAIEPGSVRAFFWDSFLVSVLLPKEFRTLSGLLSYCSGLLCGLGLDAGSVLLGDFSGLPGLEKALSENTSA